MSFKSHIVADSINSFGNRITTFLITFPRYILAEFNTHRMFSRNSASSRAIPFKKMVKAVQDHPFIPSEWMKDHPGMQGNEYLNESDSHWSAETWTTARDKAIEQATLLNQKYGVTKQMANRLLEPYMWHTCLVTSTEWENFFALRAHKDADINIQTIAFMMLSDYNNSSPVKLQPGEWHIPFRDKMPEFDYSDVLNTATGLYGFTLNDAIKISTAVCARTSYTIIGEDTKAPDFGVDIRLHDKLAQSGHWSPFEHIAKCMDNDEYLGNYISKTQSVIYCSEEEWLKADPGRKISTSFTLGLTVKVFIEFGWCGNFRGFIQHRKQFKYENRNDNRVKKQ